MMQKLIVNSPLTNGRIDPRREEMLLLLPQDRDLRGQRGKLLLLLLEELLHPKNVDENR